MRQKESSVRSGMCVGLELRLGRRAKFHMPLLAELGGFAMLVCYKHAAPNGALLHSVRVLPSSTSASRPPSTVPFVPLRGRDCARAPDSAHAPALHSPAGALRE